MNKKSDFNCLDLGYLAVRLTTVFVYVSFRVPARDRLGMALPFDM